MAVPAPEEVLANAAEAIDRHLELRLNGRPHRLTAFSPPDRLGEGGLPR